MCNELTAHAAAVADFLAHDPEEMILKSGAVFSPDRNHIIINYFNKEYTVSVKDAGVTSGGREASYNDATLILQYLVQSSGLPPRGKWISFLELPDGIHHHVPFIKDAYEPVSNAFGYDPELFSVQAKKLGGQPTAIGDTAFIIPALPKLPLAVALWVGDEEFPPKAAILFDSVAQHHLTTAALWVLGCALAKKLLPADKKGDRHIF